MATRKRVSSSRRVKKRKLGKRFSDGGQSVKNRGSGRAVFGVVLPAFRYQLTIRHHVLFFTVFW